ncbi:hypothetical protein KIN20_024651 [Parelaphostrongylus tenuis]|uniref:Uncharacterized protein n=1 Tax=Parelaphostrongylus tenuis TaxID=148309 RepID=A0AAD5MTS4_PARTN|nr:hypothetical protein KIN20_024651 [Parelaphostrongylus tenuis]
MPKPIFAGTKRSPTVTSSSISTMSCRKVPPQPTVCRRSFQEMMATPFPFDHYMCMTFAPLYYE